MVKIRKAMLEDCESCFELAKAPEFRHPDGSSPRLAWIEAFVKENQIFFIAEENKNIIGLAMGEKTTGNLALLHLIIVTKDYQNRGIGNMLLECFEKEAKKRKAIVVFLYGYAKNEKSIKFFENRGYGKGSLTYEMGKLI